MDDEKTMSAKEWQDELSEIHGMLDILYNEIRPLADLVYQQREMTMMLLTSLERLTVRRRREPPA